MRVAAHFVPLAGDTSLLNVVKRALDHERSMTMATCIRHLPSSLHPQGICVMAEFPVVLPIRTHRRRR